MQSHVRSRCPRNIATSYFLLLLILVAMMKMVKMMVTKVIALLKSLSINRMSSPVCLINVPLNEGPVWESRTHKDLHKMYATSIHIYNKCLLVTTFLTFKTPIGPLPLKCNEECTQAGAPPPRHQSLTALSNASSYFWKYEIFCWCDGISLEPAALSVSQ